MAKSKTTVEPHDAIDGSPLMGSSTYRVGVSTVDDAIREYFERRRIIVTSVEFVPGFPSDPNEVVAVVSADWQPVSFRKRRSKSAANGQA